LEHFTRGPDLLAVVVEAAEAQEYHHVQLLDG
jgi:hypothetical protein